MIIIRQNVFRCLRGLLGASLLMSLAACDLSDKIDPPLVEPAPVTVPDEGAPVAVTEEHSSMDELPEAVAAKRDEILGVLKTNSIRKLVRLAEENSVFRSNYGDLRHYDHWYILKRAGIDPIIETGRILNESYGVKDFGAEKFYIWPGFAARTPEELDFSRLSFSERARILDLVGESGIERLKAGEPYPGFRMAIREDGTWVYLLQDN
jgi:hypothetical protein